MKHHSPLETYYEFSTSFYTLSLQLSSSLLLQHVTLLTLLLASFKLFRSISLNSELSLLPLSTLRSQGQYPVQQPNSYIDFTKTLFIWTFSTPLKYLRQNLRHPQRIIRPSHCLADKLGQFLEATMPRLSRSVYSGGFTDEKKRK